MLERNFKIQHAAADVGATQFRALEIKIKVLENQNKILHQENQMLVANNAAAMKKLSEEIAERSHQADALVEELTNQGEPSLPTLERKTKELEDATKGLAQLRDLQHRLDPSRADQARDLLVMAKGFRAFSIAVRPGSSVTTPSTHQCALLDSPEVAANPAFDEKDSNDVESQSGAEGLNDRTDFARTQAKGSDQTRSKGSPLSTLGGSPNRDDEDDGIRAGVISSLQPDLNTKGGVKAGQSSTNNARELIVTDKASQANVSTPQPGKPRDIEEESKHSRVEPVVVKLPAQTSSMLKPPGPQMPNPTEQKDKSPSQKARPDSGTTEAPLLVQPSVVSMETDEQSPTPLTQKYEFGRPGSGKSIKENFFDKHPELRGNSRTTKAEDGLKPSTIEEHAIPPAENSPVSTTEIPTLKRKRSVSPHQKNVQRRL